MNFNDEWKETEIGKIPEDWDIDTLNNVCLKITDGAHASPKSFLNGCLMASVKDMSDYGFVFEECKRISKEDYELLVKNDCKPLFNDVLIAKDGSFLKHIFVVKKEIDMVILSSIAILRPKLNEVSPEFLKYYLSSNETKQRIKEGYVTGSVLPRIVLKDFKTIKIILPSLSEQKAIAKILSSLDDKIEVNNQMNKTLEEIGQAIFKRWFIDFEFPDEEGNPYKSSGGEMLESELGLIPDGWEMGPLGNYVTISKGLSYKGSGLSDKGLPLHNLNSVYEGGGYKYAGIKYYTGEYKDRHIVYPGDLIVANTEQGFDYLLIGYPAIIPKHYGEFGIFTHHIFVVRPIDNKIITSYFLYLLLKNETFRQEVTSYTNGTTVNMLSSEGIKRPVVILPKMDIMKCFQDKVTPMFELMEVNYDENIRLSQLRDLLLSKLMSGEIRVKDIC